MLGFYCWIFHGLYPPFTNSVTKLNGHKKCELVTGLCFMLLDIIVMNCTHYNPLNSKKQGLNSVGKVLEKSTTYCTGS